MRIHREASYGLQAKARLAVEAMHCEASHGVERKAGWWSRPPGFLLNGYSK